MRKTNMWMQEAFKRAGKGVFHRQLGVPTSEKIPLTFLQAIVDTKIGMVAHNPTSVGHKMVKVTALMKKRAVALLNADRANK
jgi:hypothetical protein